MIPRRYIDEWRSKAPWPDNAQVEQDLVIERALTELFSDDLIKNSLAFRGGTALHKLYLKPQARYSEDIDLVQITEEPIGPVLKRIRDVLKFLGTKRQVKQNLHNNTIIYRFDTEIAPVVNLRLKIEINTREHFNILGLSSFPFEVENGWFSGSVELTTYKLEELLGTKLRALYQRKKGRDLFDLYYACEHLNVDLAEVFHCFKEYMMLSVGKIPTSKQFLANLNDKRGDFDFINDMRALIRPEVKYNQDNAFDWLTSEIEFLGTN